MSKILLVLGLGLFAGPALALQNGCENQLSAAPLYPQETEFTCGAACLRSVLHLRRGKQFSEEQLAYLLETYTYGYTKIVNLQHALHLFKMHSRLSSNLTFDDLRGFQATGETLILGVMLDNEAHYAVMKSISKDEIVLMDPWVARGGGYQVLSRADFERRWFFTSEGTPLPHAAIRVLPDAHF
jgi:ABC-type bacteriocin/lantibiotic exporter with double-glycine peptidase domain